MKKSILNLILGMILLLAMTGCSRANSYLEDQMVKKSGVLENADYLTYEGYVNDGRIDEEGYYTEPTEEPVRNRAPVHVTFAENNNLKIQYFSDAEHLTQMSQSDCYLNPGDSIYAIVEIQDEVRNSMYEFAGFRTFELDENGMLKNTNTVSIIGAGSEYILSISKDYEGSELSIEPIGAYQQRTISLKDFCVDDSGKKTELDGTWLVNDKEYNTDKVEISPVSSYIISYQYNSDEYFFMASEPECYYSNNADGIVIFKQREPSDSTPDYSVELHKYISVSLVSDMSRNISINGGDKQSVAANSELVIPKLRYGQEVVLTTDKEWADLENCRELILMSSGREAGDYKYNLIVPEKDGEFVFDPSEYKYDHGTITFTCFGNVVTSPQILAKGSKIYYEQNTAEDGFWLAPGDNFVIVGEEAATKQQLQDIHFTPMVQVAVALEQPLFGGTVTYKVDGNKIYTDTYNTYSGTVIEMEFDAWEGWMLNSNAHDGDTYVVKDNKSQIVRGNGYEISSVFIEDKNHKPALTITLEKSVGEEMEFSISASGFKTDISSYGGGWKVTDIFNKEAGNYNIITNSQDIISQQKIGTEIPITMTMGNRALQSGEAVRFVIEKTDSADNKTSVTKYITDMTAVLDPIHIYEPSELATSKIWYKSIHITIGVVDIERFVSPTPSANTTITVRNMLTNEAMSGGELIEGSQKVTVSIVPDPGYYVMGKKVTNDVYQETMTYSEFVKNKDDIIEGHLAARYYTITLDSSDSFATYTYKLDGNEVSGTITVKEGQKLSLTYEITDSAYKLKEGAGGIPIVGWGKSYTKVSKDLTITSAMDGKTITKDDFGIEIVKGE